MNDGNNVEREEGAGHGNLIIMTAPWSIQSHNYHFLILSPTIYVSFVSNILIRLEVKGPDIFELQCQTYQK